MNEDNIDLGSFRVKKGIPLIAGRPVIDFKEWTDEFPSHSTTGCDEREEPHTYIDWLFKVKYQHYIEAQKLATKIL